MKIIFVIVFLVAVSNEGSAEECNEEKSKKCISSVELAIISQMKAIKNGETDLTSYCETLQQKGQCLIDIASNCKGDLAKISSLTSAFHSYLNQFCGEKLEIYMKMVPCFKTHEAAFNECWSHGKTKREEDPIIDICKDIEPMKCMAKLSKKKCDRGVEFGKALEKRMDTLKSEVCSGVCYLANSFWTIAVTVLSVLLMRNKM